MNKLVIKTHDFETAKQELKEFSQKKAEELKLDNVRTDGGFFGLGDHKVTGFELNSRLSKIQQHLIDLNDTNNKTIEQFGKVYNALEALDKDYIQAILISIKATEETSESIQAAQNKIKKIVEDQKRTLEVLKSFKRKLDGYDHLEDIDQIWNDYQYWYQQMVELSNSINSTAVISNENAKKIEELQGLLQATDNKTNDLSEKLNQQIEKLESIIIFTSELEKIVHLRDIDEMWESLSNVRNSILNIGHELNSIKDMTVKHQSEIETLLHFMDKLSRYEHLKDVDEIWNTTKVNSAQLSDLQKQGEEAKLLIQKNKEFTDNAIASVIEKNDLTIQQLSKKIKLAYYLAGGSLGIALIELIVILTKVI